MLHEVPTGTACGMGLGLVKVGTTCGTIPDQPGKSTICSPYLGMGIAYSTTCVFGNLGSMPDLTGLHCMWHPFWSLQDPCLMPELLWPLLSPEWASCAVDPACTAGVSKIWPMGQIWPTKRFDSAHG